MEGFIQALGAVLLAVVFSLILKRRFAEMSVLLTCLCCCFAVIAAVTYLRPVVDFLRELQVVGKLDSDMLSILLKVVGIGMITEIASLICTDAGNSALGKALQMLSGCVIAWLSLPLLTRLLELVRTILEEA